MENHRVCEARATFVAAASLFVSKEETRYYLNGVCIEPHPEQGVLIVATDGHRMAILHDEEGHTNGRWICPLPKEIKAAAKGHRRIRFEDDRAVLVDDETRLIDCAAPAIDGTFPDWRIVLKDTIHNGCKNLGIGFNGRYLAEFAKIGATLGLKNPCVTFAAANKEDPVLVRIDGAPEFLGVQMPMRSDQPHISDATESMPGWMPKSSYPAPPATPADTGVIV